jgi:hypothetical protein
MTVSTFTRVSRSLIALVRSHGADLGLLGFCAVLCVNVLPLVKWIWRFGT